jgi:hypothetical protein
MPASAHIYSQELLLHQNKPVGSPMVMSLHSLLPAEVPLDINVDGETGGQNVTGQQGPDMDAALAERMQLEELAVDDEETAALALQFAEYVDSPPISRPEAGTAQKLSYTAVAQRSETESSPESTSASQELFDTTFPLGHKILPTPGTNLRCGLYAIILSYGKQYASRTNQPSIEALMSVVDSSRYRNVVSRPQIAANSHEANIMANRPKPKQQDKPKTQRRTRSQKKEDLEDLDDFLQNDRYFSPDQLDLLLRLWGENNGLRLRLGYLHGQDAKLLGRSQADERADVVWIHYRARGAGHYSGLAAKFENESQKDQSDNSKRVNSKRGRGGGKKRGGLAKGQQRLVFR